MKNVWPTNVLLSIKCHSTAGTNVEQVNILGQQLLRHLLQSHDVVEDPDRPAMSSKNQIVVARVNLNIEHRHSRQIILQFLPVFSAIERNEQARIRFP